MKPSSNAILFVGYLISLLPFSYLQNPLGILISTFIFSFIIIETSEYDNLENKIGEGK